MTLLPAFPRTARLRTVIIRVQCRLPVFARVGFVHRLPVMRPVSDSAKPSLTVSGIDRVKLMAPLPDDFDCEDPC